MQPPLPRRRPVRTADRESRETGQEPPGGGRRNRASVPKTAARHPEPPPDGTTRRRRRGTRCLRVAPWETRGKPDAVAGAGPTDRRPHPAPRGTAAGSDAFRDRPDTAGENGAGGNAGPICCAPAPLALPRPGEQPASPGRAGPPLGRRDGRPFPGAISRRRAPDLVAPRPPPHRTSRPAPAGGSTAADRRGPMASTRFTGPASPEPHVSSHVAAPPNHCPGLRPATEPGRTRLFGKLYHYFRWLHGWPASSPALRIGPQGGAVTAGPRPAPDRRTAEISLYFPKP